MWIAEVAEVLRRELPAYARKLPKGVMPDGLVRFIAMVNPPAKQILPELGRERRISSDNASRRLGWRPRSAEEAIVAGARSLVKYGVL